MGLNILTLKLISQQLRMISKMFKSLSQLQIHSSNFFASFIGTLFLPKRSNFSKFNVKMAKVRVIQALILIKTGPVITVDRDGHRGDGGVLHCEL